MLLTLTFVICQVDLSALFTTRQQPIPDHEQVITRKAFVHHHHLLTPNQISCHQIGQKQGFSILGNLACKFGYTHTRNDYASRQYPHLKKESGSKNTDEPGYFQL